MLFNAPVLAASGHRPLRLRPFVAAASASGLLDHVPVGAERIAAAYGVVSSTFRTVAHNRAVGGVPDSYHLLGRAIDVVRRPGISHAKIAAALRTAGYVLVESLDEGDHSHFAFSAALGAQAVALSSRRPALVLSRVAADEHGSLLFDLNPTQEAYVTPAPAVPTRPARAHH